MIRDDLHRFTEKYAHNGKMTMDEFVDFIGKSLNVLGNAIHDLQNENRAMKTRLDAIARPVGVPNHRPYDRAPTTETP